MIAATRNSFLSARAWHQSVVGGQDVILRRTSALEHLQLFNGYLNENKVDVYAKQPGQYDNVNYCLVETFDDIDYIRFDNVLCTTVSQTINEMLSDYDNCDELALVEGLAEYYQAHGKSFDGLEVKPKNMDRFNSIKDWVTEYYCLR